VVPVGRYGGGPRAPAASVPLGVLRAGRCIGR